VLNAPAYAGRAFGRVFRYAVTALIAVWMLAGGVAHMMMPAPFLRVVPDPLPGYAVVYISGLVEICIGVAVLLPRLRPFAALAFSVLCAAFLPLHLWDFVRPDPIFQPPVQAGIRCLVQLVLIGLGWQLWRTSRHSRQPGKD
tara:strand:- start:13998 stop:14423 length:426 start_codon:yes stop_codon:yes gene_type:complete